MRILSLDGGGARGMLTLEVLRHIEEAQSAPIGKLFDLVIGSSIGGIIALMLTRPQPMTANGLQTIFADMLPAVFADKQWNFLGPKYDGTVLESYAQEYLDHPLAWHSPVAVTSYDTHIAKPRAIVSWHQTDRQMEHWTASDAALSTSAAPTYFPPRKERFVDGGVVANNPSTLGIVCAHELLHEPNEPLSLLSLGTGTPSNRMFKAESWGQAGWMRRIVDVMSDGTAELQHLLAPSFVSKYLRIQPEFAEHFAMDDAGCATLAKLQTIGHDAYAAAAADIRDFFATTSVSKGRRGIGVGVANAANDDLSSTGRRKDADSD